jgi:hypothetical protein
VPELVMVIHVALVVPCHAHPAAVVTLMLAVAGCADMFLVNGESA